MNRQIAWLPVFVEGVVIVGSILLAFGIQAWWNVWQEQEFEQESLARLEVEFTENLSRLGPGRTARAAVRAMALHEMLQSLPAETESLSIPDTLLAGDRVTRAGVNHPRGDAVKASGHNESRNR